MGEKPVRLRPELRGESEEQSHGQADHIRDVALDPVHQRRAQTLDCVAPGPAAPLAAGQVPIDRLRAELSEGDAAGLDPRTDRELAVLSAGADQRQRPEDLVGASRERLETPARLAL